MDEKINGNLDAISAIQISRDLGSLDATCKTVLKNKEFLALILKHAIPEYKNYKTNEIMEFIESDISTSTEVSVGRTNTQLRGENVEFTALYEKTSKFDIYFYAKNPKLSSEEIEIKLYVDLELQKNYYPGYPIEKRGIFYLARGLVSKKEQYTLSRYEFVNTENTGSIEPKQEDYDLLSLIIIRLASFLRLYPTVLLSTSFGFIDSVLFVL